MWEKDKKTGVRKPLTGLFKSVVWDKDKKQKTRRPPSGKFKEVWDDFEKGLTPTELYGKYPDLKKRTIIVYHYRWKKEKWGNTNDGT